MRRAWHASWRGWSEAAHAAAAAGIEVHAGHGLTFNTVGAVARIAPVVELNIGHFLIGEAIFGGLRPAIERMRVLMDEARHGIRARKLTQAAPMILGIGNDLIDIRRIEKTIERFGDRFLQRVFTDIERAQVRRTSGPCRVLCQAIRGQGGLRQGAWERGSGRACSGRIWA